MNLSPERQQSLIMRLIPIEREHPALYRGRIVLLAALAFLYLFLLLTLGLALAGGMLWQCGLILSQFSHLPAMRLLIPVLVLAGGFFLALLSAMCVCIPSPRGIEVTEREAAPLLIEIDRLRRELRVGRIHHVLLTPDFNAGVKQTPRFGLFGWSRNYLMLGIPLMASLTPEQFRAVVAHELGHLSGGHGRFYSWVYQLNVSWVQLLAALEHQSSLSHWLFQTFFHWFAPLFDAYTFPVRRKHEYEADRASARLVGAESTASALVATNLAARALAEGHTGVIDRRTAQRWLNDALCQRIEYRDVHPTLGERLRALDCKPAVPEMVQRTALVHYLGFKARRLAQEVGVQVLFESEPMEKPAEQPTKSAPEPVVVKDPSMPYLEVPEDWRHA